MIKKICNRKWYARIFLFIFTLGVLAPSFHDIPNQNQKEDYDFDVNTNIQNKNNSSELENIADPKVGGIANSPELANEMAPIVINMEQFSSIASALNGKDYGNIRVAYYSSDYEWKKISFQIDEIGNPYRWEDHYDPSAQEDPNPQLYQFKGYIPFGDPYGRGYDENPGKIDGTDELIFYAQNGRRVSNNLWMDPETFSHRIEVHISDPTNGADSYMYIYYTSSDLGSIESESWYQDYVSWDASEFRVSSSLYELEFDGGNFDLIDKIKIKGTSEKDLIRSSRKRFRECELADPWYSRTEGSWPSGDGFDYPGNYDTYRSAFDDPSDAYDGNDGNLQNAPTRDNDIAGEGDHRAVIDGPCRVILYSPRFEYSDSGEIIGIPAELFEQSHIWHKFYYNMMINQRPYEHIDEPPSLAPDLYVYYFFQEIMEFSNNIRNDLTLYYGADSSNPHYGQFSGGMKTLYPDGNPNNDGYNHNGDPTSGAVDPDSGDSVNPNYPNNLAVADWRLLTSESHGGLWQYMCREEQAGQPGLSEMNMYWHDGSISETGIEMEYGQVTGDGITIPELEYVTIFGDFKTSQSDYGTGDGFYELVDSNGLSGSSSFTIQSKPSGAVFEYIKPGRKYYMGRKETVELEIKTNGNGQTLSGDFSVIDSEYSAGQENVEALGNSLYCITYTLSSDNSRSAGAYGIPLTTNGHTDSSTYIELFPGDMGEITEVSSAVSNLDQGDTGLDLTVKIHNPGNIAIQITSIDPQFIHALTGTDVSNDYIINSSPTNLPYSMPASTSAVVEFDFTVDSRTDAMPEDVHLNATIDFIEGSNGFEITRYGAEIVDSWNINDISPPYSINQPDDLKVALGSSGNKIEWKFTDYSPDTYNLSKATSSDGVREIIKIGDLVNNEPIDHVLNELPLGEHYYFMKVNDTFGNQFTDEVFVNCTDDPILLNQPSNREYTVGDTGNSIMWQASKGGEVTPDKYWLDINNGERIDYYEWDGGIYITANIDGLHKGEHTVVCYVNGTKNDEEVIVSDSVQVTVNNDQPLIKNFSGAEYYKGMIDNYIWWEIDDLAQEGSEYFIYCNGSTETDYVNGTWDGKEYINVSVDGLDIGEHNFTVQFNDGLGESVDGFNHENGTVWVYVNPNEKPMIDGDMEKYMEQGEQGKEITWTITDSSHSKYFTNYTIMKNGTVLEYANETWNHDQDVNWILDPNLKLGIYNYSIYVDDGLGMNTTFSTIVYVVEVQEESTSGGANVIVLIGAYVGVTVSLSIIYKKMRENYDPYH